MFSFIVFRAGRSSLITPGENYVSIPGFSSVQITFMSVSRGVVNNGTGETTDR